MSKTRICKQTRVCLTLISSDLCKMVISKVCAFADGIITEGGIYEEWVLRFFVRYIILDRTGSNNFITEGEFAVDHNIILDC